MKKFYSLWSVATLAAWLTVSAAWCDEATDDLPRFAPLEPHSALRSIKTLPGFQAQLVAAEPLIRSPVALDFDENGRLFVVEMCGYSEQGEQSLGSVRMLEDTDGDGSFDRSTVYAEKLSWPTAVICFDGGVFVGAAPDIYYFKDHDHDGRADERRVVFTGFNRHNVQGLFNSFRWGLDNRIHGATSTNGGRVNRPDQSDQEAIDLQGRDFSFDPRSFELRPESGGAQHGMSFDDWGRKFATSNSDHLQMVLYDDRYAARNPHSPLPPARRSIAADGAQAEVFRLSPVEPWRVWRTRLRVEGKAPGVVEGGGRAAGYFSGATGATIYRGDAFPAEYRGQAFIGDVGSNLVHRKLLKPDGVSLIGTRIDEGREFIASTDTWFRPAQFANAPDGTLYIIDMYREVIEHPWSIPEEIKQHLDLASGSDRGRIYRIIPGGFVQPTLPKLGDASTSELVETLSHRNGWHRDVAARLLFERQDTTAIGPLRKLVRIAPLAEGRLQALYVLHGMGEVAEEDLLSGLNDRHPRVREHAIRIAEFRVTTCPAIRERLFAMTTDPDIRVLYQLAWTLGEVQAPAAWQALADLALSAEDPMLQAAITSSLVAGGGEVLPLLMQESALLTTLARSKVFPVVFEQLSSQANAEQLAQFDAVLANLTSLDSRQRKALAKAVVSGARSREQLPYATALVEQLVEESVQAALSEDLPVEARVAALHVLELGKFSELRDAFADLLAGYNPQAVQLASIDVLGHFSDPEIANILLEAWPGMTPSVRSTAGHTLLSRKQWLDVLLTATEAGEFAFAELDPTLLMQISHRQEPELKKRVGKLLDRYHVGNRDDLVRAYRSSLELTGDASRGRAVFEKTCSSCHRLDGVGHEIGPNLAAMKNRGAEAILLNVLDPNREVNPQYVNYILVTADGRTLDGMIAAETANSITLRRSEDKMDTVLRADIEELRSTGQSLMPEGLEKEIDETAMADLIAYLLRVDDKPTTD